MKARPIASITTLTRMRRYLRRRPLLPTIIVASALAVLTNPIPAHAHMSCTTATGLSCSGGVASITTVPVANGGTGAATASAGFDALSPMTTQGDIIHGGASGTGTRLAIGSANYALKVNSGGTDIEYGLLPVAGGGTGAATATAGFDALSPMTAEGDLILGGASGTGARLAIGSNTHVLTSNGTTASWQAPSGGGITFAPQSVQTTEMNLNGDSLFFSPSSGMLCATESDCKTPTQTALTLTNLTARANQDIGGTNHTIEIAQGSCTSAITFDCTTGDICVTVSSAGSQSPTAADTDELSVSAGNCYVGKITASGDTNSGVIHSIAWDAE